jgi:Aerotolerance regulator N-terminal/von Willebrand factor type A domain
MSFLSPWFLLGALAVAGPILFHLIRRTARERTSFSSLMFLRPTPPRAVRRSKLEHIWLLLLRCLCLLLLALGFARPFFARDISPPPAASQERRLILLVDTSASMRRQSLWEKARAVADEYLDKASPSDQVAVLTFDLQPRTLVSFADWSSWSQDQRATLARQRLAALAPGWMGTHLGLALTGAAEQFRENSVSRREIVLITDLQEGAKLDGLQGYQWPAGTRVLVRALAAKRQSNAGLEILEQPAGAAGVDGDVHVRVSNSSDSRKEKFSLGWQGANERMDIYLTPGQTRTFTAPKLPAGMISNAAPGKILGLALELSGDDLDYDNLSYYARPEIQNVSIYCAGLGSADDSTGMFYYLQRAFPSTPRWQVQFAPELTEKTSFAVIATNLEPEQITALRRWMESGKSALLVLANPYAAATLVNLLGLPEARMTESEGEFALLGSIDFQHPIFKPFDDPRFSDFSHIHFWKHQRWDIPPAIKARVLAKFDDDSPALFQVDMGQGRLLVLTSSWNPADSQLAVSSKFPPLLETMLDWSGASAPARFQFHTGDTIPAPPSAGERVTWSKPAGGKPIVLPADAPFADTDRPGIYKAAWAGRERLFAVNIPLEESRTAPISQDDLARLGVPLGWDSEQAAAVARVHQQRLQDAELENRQKLWRWLIVAALAVTLGEIVLSGWLARRVTAAGAT